MLSKGDMDELLQRNHGRNTACTMEKDGSSRIVTTNKARKLVKELIKGHD